VSLSTTENRAGAAVALAGRPDLWSTAVRELFVLARPGWWRRWPPLPRPDPAYLRFRLQTAYGSSAPERSRLLDSDPDDIVSYLEWCRRMRHTVRHPA
jgi:hypothetical protein